MKLFPFLTYFLNLKIQDLMNMKNFILYLNSFYITLPFCTYSSIYGYFLRCKDILLSVLFHIIMPCFLYLNGLLYTKKVQEMWWLHASFLTGILLENMVQNSFTTLHSAIHNNWKLYLEIPLIFFIVGTFN